MYSPPHYSPQNSSSGMGCPTDGILEYSPPTAATAEVSTTAMPTGENGSSMFGVAEGLLSRDETAMVAANATAVAPTEPDSDLAELSRLMDLDAPRDGVEEGGFSCASTATPASTAPSIGSSGGGSVWSSEEDERDQKLHSPPPPPSSSASTSASNHPIMASMLVDLHCNDESFSCFGESILFGCEEDELQNVEEVVPADLALPPEGSPGGAEQQHRVVVARECIDGPLERDPTTQRYHCPHCDKSFQYVSRLRRHLTAHQSKRHKCSVCDKLFSRADVLASHRAKVHGEPEAASSSPAAAGPQEKRFSCPQCPAVLKSRHHLQGWRG